MITRQERQEINADLRFYAMRSALIALRAPRGSLGRRLTMVFEAAKMLVRRAKVIRSILRRPTGVTPEK
jgi:hypothetical protein